MSTLQPERCRKCGSTSGDEYNTGRWSCDGCDNIVTFCPECGSEDIGDRAYNDGGGHYDHKNQCEDCGCEWW